MDDEPKPEPKPDNSGDIVTNKTLAHIKKLETTIATLTDKQTALETRNAENEKLLSGLRNIPSQTKPNRSLLDELNDFVFGTPPATPPEKG
jgi:hypothetical protein